MARSRTLFASTVVAVALLATSAFALGAAVRAAGDIDTAELAIGDARAASAPRALPLRADMLGATWRGAASGIELRTRSPRGAWSAWVTVEAGGDGPDGTSREGRSSARRTQGRRGASSP